MQTAALNQGVVLTTESISPASYHTSEAVDPALRPSLTMTYAK